LKAERLRDLRKKYGYRQEDVAAALGVLRCAYTRLETGDRQDIPLSRAIALANIFDRSVEEIEFPCERVKKVRSADKPTTKIKGEEK